ncbi:serine/threonine protein kinase [Tunturiibacter gelidoferens]|uniref:Uncharacterized protein n=1 Tax=Tunturiibacter gelidiferens TaxID=3069689 RepID=A0ACC5P3N0_9BACT|nr:serine/threonine protein kinase [Edaphobacter lichenicola]MBB5341460.1 hypothetical protein [Edaphobacter lichenicola]
MSDAIAGFPFWRLQFDKDGKGDTSVETFLGELPNSELTDLFIFSHGWNNDRAIALDLYTRFFGAIRELLENGTAKLLPGVKIGCAGIFWPSILFPGDTAPPAGDGGASSFSSGDERTLDSELPKAFCQPDQQAELQGLIELLNTRPSTNEALLTFRDKLNSIITLPELRSTQDSLESLPETDDDRWFRLLDAAAQAPADDEGGAAGLGGFFDKMWNGAQQILRVATYWEMKNRAGVIGKGSVGPLIVKIHSEMPELRIHLIGHSFGARLVSYTLAGLSNDFVGPKSPIKMLYLLQGAFSHFAFAPKLSFDPDRAGDLHGMASRVDGPLVTTHSKKDTAVGVAYPAASFLAGADAADAGDVMYRWEGMGCDGAQESDAAEHALGDVPYEFVRGSWLNLDGNNVIVAGGPPSGAHSDIVHPETAFVALSAANVLITE